MTALSDDISGYSDKDIKISEDGLDIDFSRAKLLNTTGSICDAYEYRQGTRRVFVKKLKARYQNSPRHRAALAKEYEIGASLSHPSLAVYRYAKNDYIVTDFIDGKTIASMIKNNDPWLESGENAVKILRELTSVIGYLHDRNLVHSDIKADNVMITNGTHNAVLVDFDKCHSSSLDMVSGNPGLYGVKEDETGNPQIDFNGLARIAEKLSGIVKSPRYKKLLRRFANVCGLPDVNPDKILKSLQPSLRNSVRTIWISITVLVILSALFAIIFFSINRNSSNTNVSSEEMILENNTDSIESDAIEKNNEAEDENEAEDAGIDIAPPTDRKSEEKVDLTSLNRELEQIYYPLYGEIDMTLGYIQEQGGADILSGKEAMQLITNVNELQQEVWNKGFKFYQSHFPQLEYKEAYEGYSKFPAFQNMVHSVDSVNALLLPVVKSKTPDLRNRSFNYDNMDDNME